MPKRIETTVQWITVATPIIVFMGFLKLYFFYGHFNINIAEYLDASEILTSFLDDMVFLIRVAFLMLLHVLVLSFLFRKVIVFLHNRLESKKTVRDFYKATKNINFTGLCFGLIMSVLSYALYFYLWEEGLYIFLLFVIQVYLSLYELTAKPKKDYDLPKGITLLLVIIGILAIPYISAEREYRELRESDQSSYIIETKNRSYSFSENDKFLGKTNKYVFIYYQDRIRILTIDELKSVSFFYKKIENEV